MAEWVGAAALLVAGPAWAQIGPLPPLGLPSLGVADRLPAVGDIDRLGARVVNRALQAPSRLHGLIRSSGGVLEADPLGWPVVAGEIVAIDLSRPARDRALDAGFTVVREERLETLDLTTTVLAPPRRLSLSQAMERLRDLDPEAEITFNHV
ncbi:peptidase S8, partial [Brevundimonas sp. M-11_2]